MKIICDSWEEKCRKRKPVCCCAENGKDNNYSEYIFNMAFTNYNKEYGEKQDGRFLHRCLYLDKNVHFIRNDLEYIMKEIIKKHEEEVNEKSSKEASINNKD